MTHAQEDDDLDPATATAWSFFERLSRRDLDGAFALLAEDATFWTNAYRKAMPKKSTVRMLTKVLNDVPMHFELLRSMSQGNVVAMEMTSSGETPDHEEYDMTYAFWIEVRDGLIVNVREHADTLYGHERIQPSALRD